MPKDRLTTRLWSTIDHDIACICLHPPQRVNFQELSPVWKAVDHQNLLAYREQVHGMFAGSVLSIAAHRMGRFGQAGRTSSRHYFHTGRRASK